MYIRAWIRSTNKSKHSDAAKLRRYLRRYKYQRFRVISKLFYWLFVFPLEVIITVICFISALLAPFCMFFTDDIGVIYALIAFSSFGLLVICSMESMLFLKRKVFTEAEYKTHLGERSWVSSSTSLSFFSEIQRALIFAIDSHSSEPKSVIYKKLLRLSRVQRGLFYLMFIHAIIIVTVTFIYG